MWIFTRYGMFSAVCARKGNGSLLYPVDKERIQIRSRSVAHLEALCKAFDIDAEIVMTPDNDYPCRIFITKTVFVATMAVIAVDVDYDNFKGACGASKPLRKNVPLWKQYLSALHDVWSIMYQITPKTDR